MVRKLLRAAFSDSGGLGWGLEIVVSKKFQVMLICRSQNFTQNRCGIANTRTNASQATGSAPDECNLNFRSLQPHHFNVQLSVGGGRVK